MNSKNSKILSNSFIKYIIVGAINTTASFIIIFYLMYKGAIPEIANFIGYISGVLLSYLLNKYFTFKSKNKHTKEFIKFSICMGIAYLINLFTLIIFYRYFEINEYISQIISAVFYTLSGYLLSKFYAFRK